MSTQPWKIGVIILCAGILVGLIAGASLFGRRDQEEPAPAPAAKRTMTYDGREWWLDQASATVRIHFLVLDGELWRCEDPSLVLFDGKVDPKTHQLFERIRGVYHISEGDDITFRGRHETLYRDGEREVVFYDDQGELHGEQRNWYPNGKLKVVRPYVHGKVHGRTQHWYESGKPMVDAIYVNDVEIEGKSWREDGTEL